MDDHHLPTINLDWSQGAGFCVEVCVYSKYCCVHVQLKHVAFLELYCITPADNSFLNANIKFADARKPSNLTASFLKQIALVKGCRFSTVEALWKYYCAAVKCHRRKEAYSLLSASGVPLEHPLPHANFLSNMTSELSTSTIDAFDNVVSETYKSAFQTHYSTFTLLGHHLLQPSNVRRLYASVVRLFLLIHCVLAMTVSSSDYWGEIVSISSLFLVVTNQTPCDFDYLDEYEDDEGVECNDIHDDDG
jgi:hypothetical protein